jgi:hypothetical protein
LVLRLSAIPDKSGSDLRFGSDTVATDKIVQRFYRDLACSINSTKLVILGWGRACTKAFISAGDKWASR